MGNEKKLNNIIILFIMICTLLTTSLTSCNNKVLPSNVSDLYEYDKLNEDYSSFNTYNDFKLFKDKVINDNKEHIVYLGKPSCPWCREYIYYYDLVSKETGKKIDYFNLDYIKGELLDTNSGIKSYGDDYQLMYDLVYDYEINTDLELTTTNRGVYAIYVPIIFKLKDGVIIDALGEVKGHTLGVNGLRELTESEKNKFICDLKLLFN